MATQCSSLASYAAFTVEFPQSFLVRVASAQASNSFRIKANLDSLVPEGGLAPSKNCKFFIYLKVPAFHIYSRATIPFLVHYSWISRIIWVANDFHQGYSSISRARYFVELRFNQNNILSQFLLRKWPAFAREPPIYRRSLGNSSTVA